jgi:hypothetical protein
VGVGSYKIKEVSLPIKNLTVSNENNTSILYLESSILNKLKPNEGAYVRVYLPNTVRKNSFILIPSALADFATSTKPTPKKEKFRDMNRAFINFGIDVYKDETSGDWVFDSSGNFRKAVGMKAVRQAVLNALKTTQGELPFHPTYGVQSVIGDAYAGRFDDAVVVGTLLQQAVLKDARFQQVLINKLNASPTSTSVQLIVKIKGYDSPIPLAFVSS